jgi:hypothetical protein
MVFVSKVNYFSLATKAFSPDFSQFGVFSLTLGVGKCLNSVELVWRARADRRDGFGVSCFVFGVFSLGFGVWRLTFWRWALVNVSGFPASSKLRRASGFWVDGTLI